MSPHRSTGLAPPLGVIGGKFPHWCDRRDAGTRGGAKAAATAMSTFVGISVVIAAHNEEAVLDRCLDALLRTARTGELEIAVVCNGCTDGTAEVARGFGEDICVLETPRPPRPRRLNLGDPAVSGFPRFYVDADVLLPLDSVRRIAARLAEGEALAAAPVMSLDLRSSSLAVRAYYRIWAHLPYVREGMIGVGVYALSDDGPATLRGVPRCDRRRRVRPQVVRRKRARSRRRRARPRLCTCAAIRSRTHQDPEPPRSIRAAGTFPQSRRARAVDEVLPQRARNDRRATLALASRRVLCSCPCRVSSSRPPAARVDRRLRLGARPVVAPIRPALM